MKQVIRGAGGLERFASRVVASIEAIPSAVWILGFPLIVVFTTTSTINQAGYLDPYIYAAYVHDFTQTAGRYGQTYYSERIAYILADMALLRLFGVEMGYLISRGLMLTIATASVYSIGRIYYGKLVGILAASWLCFIPWLGTSLWWTHYDGFATVYLLAAIALLFVPVQQRVYWSFSAGVVWMLAVNAQYFLLAIGGLIIVPWVVINSKQGVGWIFRNALAVLFGMIACFAVLALVYKSMTPENFKLIGVSSLGIASWSFSGGAANWFAPLQNFYKVGLWIPGLLPAFLLIGSIAWWLQRRRNHFFKHDPFVAFLLYGILVTLICLGLHFFFSFGILSLFYYTIYLLPACILVLIGVAGRAYRHSSAGSSISILLISAVPLLLWLSLGLYEDMIDLTRLQNLLIIAGLIAVGVFGYHVHSSVPVASMVAITFLSVLEYGNGHYNVRSSRAAQAIYEWDVYRGAIEFQKWVGEVAPVGSNLVFWYPGQGEAAALNSIQSMYLWGYSGLTSHPYPEITPEVKEAMLVREFLCLIALDDAGLAAGLASIEAQGIAFEEVARFAHDGEVWDFRSVMIRLPKQP